jgi:hypothetical protein
MSNGIRLIQSRVQWQYNFITVFANQYNTHLLLFTIDKLT